ncbi:MAG: hypothetical protein IJH07_09475, partial [Ruminococcus sp.]|nr:hypothetical protein [Ruminococcus sp.]
DDTSLIDKLMEGTILVGAGVDTCTNRIGRIQPLVGAIKSGKAFEGAVKASVEQLDALGSLTPKTTVDSRLVDQISQFEQYIKEYTYYLENAVPLYDTLIAKAAVGGEALLDAEDEINALLNDWSIHKELVSGRFNNIYRVLNKTDDGSEYYSYSCADVYFYQRNDQEHADDYDEVIRKIENAFDVLRQSYSSFTDLDNMVLVIRGNIWYNNKLLSVDAFGKKLDKFINKYDLEDSWEDIKEEFEDGEIGEYLKEAYPDIAETAEGLGKVKELYDAKQEYRKIKKLTEDFGQKLGTASTQGTSAVLAVLSNEGVALMNEFEALKPYAEFLGNTLKLIQLANEKDEMTKLMGEYGGATLKLNYHTYEAVKNDTTTGELTEDSDLVKKLTALIEEAIDKSNRDNPGVFKPMTEADRKSITDYLVKYLNVQRAKYPRSEDPDSNWMFAHVSAVMAALFEQVYVESITEQATPQNFLKYMQDAGSTGVGKGINTYVDSTIDKRVFRDVRIEAIGKVLSAKTLVTHYSDKIAKNSTYPVKQVVNYLSELSQKMSAAANVGMLSTSRYKDLNIWQIITNSATQLTIDDSYTISFRDYQKALLNTDIINSQNRLIIVDYYKAALYDLIVRSGLLVMTLSPNGYTAMLGAMASAQWSSLAAKAFAHADEVWLNRSTFAAMSIAQLSLTMGTTVMKESEIAIHIYNLIEALDKAIIFDPPLDTELVTYSVKDVVIPDGESTGTGEVLVTFRNDGDKTVAISPSVSIYSADGWAASADFDSQSILIPAGQTAEFTGSFTVDNSVLTDSTGYSAVLTYTASEPSTVSIAAEQGPFVKHFYAGTDRQIAAMRSKVSAGTLVSGWVTGQDTLEGSITVKAGQSLRIFAAAPVNGALAIEIISPSGEKLTAASFINEGDYVTVTNCEAGDYTVRVTTPEVFDNRITVEGVVSSFDKAIAAVQIETETLINCNNVADDGSCFNTINVSVSESAGIDAGAVDMTLTFADDHLSAYLVGVDDPTLNAFGALNGGFVVKATADTPAGEYIGTLKVSFDRNTCDPVFLSVISSGDYADQWSIEGDRVVYTAQVIVTVDVTVPETPELTVTDGKKEGTLKVTGNAPDAMFVILYYENDYEETDGEGNPYTYTSRTIAAIIASNADGSFGVIISKPQIDARITAVAVNAAGGLSAGASDEAEGYTQSEQQIERLADAFTSVKAEQIDGKRDVTVTVYGAHMTGLTTDGELWYRVADSEPDADYPTDGAFDPAEWISAGAVSAFTVKDFRDGQFIEVVQVMGETAYTTDDKGDVIASGMKYTVLRHGSTAAAMTEVPGYTVSGTLIPGDSKTDVTDTVMVLTDASDRTRTYTVPVQMIGGAAAYTFIDVIAGTYILSLDGSDDRIGADDLLITVGQDDVIQEIGVYRTAFDVTGSVMGVHAQRYLTDAAVVLIDSEDNEAARTAVQIDGDSAAYRFADVRPGDYTVRLVSDTVAAKDSDVTVTDTDASADIAIDRVWGGILGDADGNGIVEIIDVTYLQRLLAHVDIPYTQAELMRGDVDGDGELTVLDVTLIQRYLCGLKTNLSIGKIIA